MKIILKYTIAFLLTIPLYFIWNYTGCHDLPTGFSCGAMFMWFAAQLENKFNNNK